MHITANKQVLTAGGMINSFVILLASQKTKKFLTYE